MDRGKALSAAKSSIGILAVLGLLVGTTTSVTAQSPEPEGSEPVLHTAPWPSSRKTVTVFSDAGVRLLRNSSSCTSQPCEDPAAPRQLPLRRGRSVHVTTDFPTSHLRVEVA